MIQDPQVILKRYWGYERFRSPQQEIISNILEKKDTLALLPTGGGKSLCYQLPSLIFAGKTVVVSPLISLMLDQVKELESRNISAKAIHSGLSYREVEAILDNFVYGPLKLLYVSPERLTTEAFQVRFHMANVDLIAIDEAHCISQWGHDFRPSYLNINILRELKPEVPMIALTATATKNIIEDIITQLDLRSPAIFRNSFARDNISFSTIKSDDKSNEFIKIISSLKGSGIIYTRSRLACVKITNWLKRHKVNCIYYHGGMTTDERLKAQNTWMANKVRVIAATNAFGMGINKPDVRFVIHLDIPPSMEEYYQEAGRAGRDGRQSYAISIVSNQDMMSAVRNFETYHPTLEEIKAVYTSMCRYLKISYDDGIDKEYFFNIDDFSKNYKIHGAKVRTTLQVLEKQGWLEMSEGLKTQSTAMVIENPRIINDLYEQEDPRYIVLSQLLRTYEGIFMEYVSINESKLARILNMDLSKIIGYLKVLQNEGIIHYNPSEDLPKIYMLKARPRDESFKIDEIAYKKHKDALWKRLNSMIAYYTNDRCRQQTILEYFDEGETYECGQCDICLGSNDTTYDDSLLQEVLRLISTKAEGINPKLVVSNYPYNKRKRVYQCLTDLESEQKIRVDEKGLLRVN